MFNKILLVLTVVLFIYGCSEDTLVESNNELVVVTGFLRAGEKSATVQLAKTLALGSSDSTAEVINNAEVYLVKGSKTYPLVVSSQLDGNYTYRGNELSIASGDAFTLQINYNNKRISGSTVVPSKPTGVTLSKSTLVLSATSYGMGFTQDTTSIYVKWNNPDSSLYYVVIENLEATPTAINTNTTQRFANRTMVFPPMATNQFLIARRNLTYLGNHRAIVYKVNQEYADLYESRTQDSRNLNEPISNITNGLGVFSAFASDTTMFYVKTQ